MHIFTCYALSFSLSYPIFVYFQETLANCPSQTGAAGTGLTVGIIVSIFFIVLLVVAIVGWFWYAYKNPTTRSGMWLMEVRV
jgi:hypothetical protein